MRRATRVERAWRHSRPAFQSTLSMRRATQRHSKLYYRIAISIHALHEESDNSTTEKRSDCLFQSTLSMRRATHRPMTLSTTSYISIHALHEESDRTPLTNAQIEAISIHALHEESDFFSIRSSCTPVRFQSTLSMRRATIRHVIVFRIVEISIHALHEESDVANP